MSKSEITPKTFRVSKGAGFKLSRHSTHISKLYDNKKDYEKILKKCRAEMDELQHMMYAHNRYALLCVFQAMDAAGKDSTIRNVFAGVNPHGLQIFAFKKPSDTEIDHDFLWRTSKNMPERGRIGVFNRSYYEEVLVVRVHPEILSQYQRVPTEHTTALETVWKNRYEDIKNFEKYAFRNGVHVLKFFLNVSKKEQGQRFLARIDEAEKNWKFSEADLKERGYWNEYMSAYEKCIRSTATEYAPWYVIPADDKRNMRLIVAQLILEKLRNLDIHFPKVNHQRREELSRIRDSLIDSD